MTDQKTTTTADQKPRKEGKTARGLRLRRTARLVILSEATKLQNKVDDRIKGECKLKTPQENEECALYLVKELHRMFKFMAISGDHTKLETDIMARTKKLQDRWNAEANKEKEEREKVAAGKAARKKEREKKAAEDKKDPPSKDGKPAEGKRVPPKKVKIKKSPAKKK